MGLLDNKNFRMSVDRNPYAQSPTMTPEEYKAAMIDANTPARFKPENKNRSFFSPSLVPGEGTYTDPYTGMQRKQGSNIDFLKTGDEIQTLRKEALAKEKAFAASGDTVQSTLPDKGESLLPDPKLEGKSFKDKLNSVADKIFNMQSNNPEAYASMLSGLDLYSRSQTQDFATAMLGNNKFNADQASALLQSNKKAMEMKILEANYNKGLQPESASTSEIEVAKGLVKGKVDKDNVDSIANYIAGDAKVLMQSIPGLTYNQAAVIAFQQAQQSGILKEDNAFFRKKLEFNPDADISKSATLKQLQELNPGLSEEAIRKQAKIEGVTIR
tara:strand:- start:191 stop:1174 length:984 start_codon:yes stop_codon:yes gene_type:complete